MLFECYVCFSEGEFNMDEKSSKFRLYGFRSRKIYKEVIASIYIVLMVLMLIGFVTKQPYCSNGKDYNICTVSNLLIWVGLAFPYLIM